MYPNVKKIEYGENYYSLSRQQIDEIKKEICIYTKFDFVEYKKSDKKEQHYNINVTENKIEISSSSDIGFFYGNQTLKQLLKSDGILCCKIEDYPDLYSRIAMIEVSRTRIPTMKELKKLISLLAALKFNQIQLYFECAFAYKNYEKAWGKLSPFTSDEIIDVKKYCSDRGVDLVPNQNSLGHLERFLMHDEYKHLAECPEGGAMRYYDMSIPTDKVPSNTISVISEEAFDFVKEMWEELFPLFDSQYANVGCDEPWELGKGVSKSICDEKGKDNVYLDYLYKLNDYIKSKGKTMMFWGDIIQEYPDRIKDVPDDAIAMIWGYEVGLPKESILENFKNNNLKFYNCLGTSTWLSISGRYKTAYKNIRDGAKNALKYNAMGAMITDWGDRGHHQQPIICIPQYILAGNAFWDVNKEIDIVDALSSLYFKDEDKSASGLLMDIENLSQDYNLGSCWNAWGLAFHTGILKVFNDGIKSLADGDYEGCRKRLQELLERAENIKGDCENFDILKSQMVFTLKFIDLFLDYTKSLFKSDDISHDSVDKDIKQKTHAGLDKLTEEYKRLWRLTCREGGLSESIQYFKQF